MNQLVVQQWSVKRLIIFIVQQPVLNVNVLLVFLKEVVTVFRRNILKMQYLVVVSRLLILSFLILFLFKSP